MRIATVRCEVVGAQLVLPNFRAAWKDLNDLPSNQAQQQYVVLLSNVCPAFDQTVSSHNTPGAPAGHVFSSLAQANEAADVTNLPVSDPLNNNVCYMLMGLSGGAMDDLLQCSQRIVCTSKPAKVTLRVWSNFCILE